MNKRKAALLNRIAKLCETELASTELNDKIAAALGWKNLNPHKQPSIGLKWRDPEGNTLHGFGPPNWVNDISDASELLIQTRDKTPPFVLINNVVDGTWVASIDHWHVGVAKSEPLARTAAALRYMADQLRKKK